MSWLLRIWQGHRSAVVVLAAFVAGALLAFLLSGPAPVAGGLTKKQARAVAATRDSANHAVQRDTARARRATVSARFHYAAGRRAESNAALLHTQTHVIHRPLPAGADSSAAVADSLTRLLSAY